MIDPTQIDRLTELQDIITDSLEEASKIIRDADLYLYERWQAYGKQVTDEFVTMGPTLSKVIEDLQDEEQQEELQLYEDDEEVCCKINLDEEN